MLKLIFRVIVFIAVLIPFQPKVLSISRKTAIKSEPMQIVSVLPPQEVGPCTVSSTTLDMNGIETDVYFPGADPCSDGTSAPYPPIMFAHGFSMFGLSDGRVANQGNAEHLASWGYVVAIPALPDDAEDRIAIIINGLDYLETANGDPGSLLYQRINTNLMAAAGYSLGGATALAVTARDSRIQAVVALDPVYHEGGPSGEGDLIWDPVAEAPNILVPTGILGAPADACNAESDYQDIYPLIGTHLKASFHIVDASHCVFPDPGNSFCSITCGGTNEAYMTLLSQKYMTAWFNFHLQGKSEYYSYLYGSYADEDINAGLIIRQVDTFPGGSGPPIEVAIEGATTGTTEKIYQFTANVKPITTTIPIQVVWSATDLDVITRTVETVSDEVEMNWLEPGIKTISVTVMNSDGLAKGAHQINIYQTTQADFDALPLIWTAPVTVTFTNTSIGDYSSSYWEFGDGHTSIVDNPTHVYREEGSYTVALTIDGNGGKDQETKVGFINVYAQLMFLPLVER